LLETVEVVPEEEAREAIATAIRGRQDMEDLSSSTNRLPFGHEVIANGQRTWRKFQRET
jgi:hypothetical protein